MITAGEVSGQSWAAVTLDRTKHYDYRLLLIILLAWQGIDRCYVKCEFKRMFTVGGDLQCD
jgi:hypothetical protein